MGNRLELHTKLCTLLGNSNVYFQPPENLKLQYPCIVYELDTVNVDYADDNVFISNRRYDVTHIFKNVNDELIDDMIRHFTYCSHERRFIEENLYHDLYSIYY